MATTKTLSTSPSTLSEEPVDVSATPFSLAKGLHSRRAEYTRKHRIKIKVATWNVAACPGADKDLGKWFLDGEGVDTNFAALNVSENPVLKESDSQTEGDSDTGVRVVGGDAVGIYVLGLQEVVDLGTTKEYVNRAYSDSGPKTKWKAAIEESLPKGYQLIDMEQMIGLMLLIYASPEVASTISNVSTKAIGTGLFGYLGNKGAVSTRFLLGEATSIVFINSHLASGAGSSYLDRRCWDVGQILSKTQFDPVVHAGVEEDEGEKIGDEDFAFWFGDLNFRLDGIPGDDIRRILTLHARGEYGLPEGQEAPPIEGDGVLISKDSEGDGTESNHILISSREPSFDSETTLPDPDDFPEDPSQDPTSLQATLDSLLPHDQLLRVIRQKKLFHEGWREGPITFLPTYKYDVGTVGLFDSSEKQRAPSWCDRILYRTRSDKREYERKVQEKKLSEKKDEEMKSRGMDQDEDVLFSYDPETDGEDHGIAEYDEYDENEDQEEQENGNKEEDSDIVQLEVYTSHQRITSSDHKPITSIFTIEYDAIVPRLKAKVHAEVARDLDRVENEGRPGITVVVDTGNDSPDVTVDFGDLGFLQTESYSVTIANTSGVTASFAFVEKPMADEDEETRGGPAWVTTSFVSPDVTEAGSGQELGKSVTLEPGETILAVLEAQISSVNSLHSLNDNSVKLEDILVLRVEDGRDHFIPVRASWAPTCFGRSIDELIRIPDGGIRKFVQESQVKGSIPYDKEVHCSAPKELFKLTDAIQTLAERCIADEAMLDNAELPKDPGWPFEAKSWTLTPSDHDQLRASVVVALDTNIDIVTALPIELSSAHKLEVVSSVLLLFLASMAGGLVPSNLWAKITTSIPNLASQPPSSWPDTKTQILDILAAAPNHNIAFVFLTATLCRVAGQLSFSPNSGGQSLARRMSFRKGNDDGVKKRRAREKRYAELVGPVACRSVGDGKGTKDKERTVIEMFLRADEGN